MTVDGGWKRKTYRAMLTKIKLNSKYWRETSKIWYFASQVIRHDGWRDVCHSWKANSLSVSNWKIRTIWIGEKCRYVTSYRLYGFVNKYFLIYVVAFFFFFFFSIVFFPLLLLLRHNFSFHFFRFRAHDHPVMLCIKIFPYPHLLPFFLHRLYPLNMASKSKI